MKQNISQPSIKDSKLALPNICQKLSVFTQMETFKNHVMKANKPKPYAFEQLIQIKHFDLKISDVFDKGFWKNASVASAIGAMTLPQKACAAAIGMNYGLLSKQ